VEVDPVTFVQVVEAVSRVDGATGWCVMIAARSRSFFARHLEGDTQR